MVIGQSFREAPDDLTHEIGDEVVGDDRFAFTLKCTYPTGGLVMVAGICDVREGRITRQLGVEAWDE